MMVFFKERLAYLATPKTGTSALETALEGRASMIMRDPPGLKHTTARGFNRKFRSVFERNGLDKMETCAVVREPLDWLGSWYRYRRRPALVGKPNSTAQYSFDEFLQAYMTDTQPPFAKVGSQARFVSDETGEVAVDHLFRYDHLSHFYRFLEARLNCEIETSPQNVSPSMELSVSKDTKLKILQRLAADYEIYDSL